MTSQSNPGTFRVMPQTPALLTPSHFQPGDLKASAEVLMAHETREDVHLRQGMEILAELWVPARALVRHGLVVDEISDEACEGDYALVIVGTYDTEGWMRPLLRGMEFQIGGCCPDRPILVAKSWTGE